MTDRTSSTTVLALLRKTEQALAEAGVEYPAGDAKEIAAAVLRCSPAALRQRYNDSIPQYTLIAAADMVQRRIQGEPIQYVIGMWSFMGRGYKVGRGVLIPRDDTEVVVHEALRLIRSVPEPRIVDLCAGSGIIAVTLQKELPNAAVCAVEKSEDAFGYLTQNIALNEAQVEAICADLADCVSDFADESLDMIVSNPPYIRSDEIAALQREVQYEPRLALDGGYDGYDFYHLILSLWTQKLKEGGCIAFEIGEGQYENIAKLLRQHGYKKIVGYPDIQGIIRAITAQKSAI